MNKQTYNEQINRKYILALGTVALLSVAVFGFSALLAKADTNAPVSASNSASNTKSAVVITTATSTGVISGTVFNDTNHDKVLSAGEAGIAGVTLKLSVLKNNNWFSFPWFKKYVSATTTVTDANGNYAFTKIAAGTYKVEEVKKSGWHRETVVLKPVTLSTTVNTVTGLNFANSSSTISTSTSNGHNNHDRKDKDDKKDDNTKDKDNDNRGATVSAAVHGALNLFHH